METQSKRVKIIKGLSHIKVKVRIMKTMRLMRDPPDDKNCQILKSLKSIKMLPLSKKLRCKFVDDG